jgi:hypothetical protein
MAGRAGVVDLRDLGSRYAWDELKIAGLIRAAGLEPQGPVKQRFGPPEVVVAVVAFEDMEQVERSRAWLQDAQRVLVLRRHDEEPIADAELRDYVEELWQELATGFAVPLELHDWRTEADLRGTLKHAAELAEQLDASPASAPPRPAITLPPGPRFEWLPRQYGDPLNFAQALASGLRLASTGAVLDTETATFQLATQTEAIQQDRFGFFDSALPDGRRVVRERSKEGRTRWLLGEQAFTAYGDVALGFDVNHPVGWTGHRMFLYWLYLGQTGPGYLSCTDHDYPCGPSKKLYGYADNDPVRAELAADASYVAFTFEHDVLLTSALPIRWRSAGALDVADFQRDLERTALFVHDPESPFTTDLLDEDARDRPPVVVLGPSPSARYAVDLSAPTYRIAGATPNEARVVIVGGPEPYFAVFNTQHELSRKASGQLLGGASGHALVLDGGSYFREELGCGQRTPLGSAEGAPVCAVPVPGTCNVVLVTSQDSRYFAQLI